MRHAFLRSVLVVLAALFVAAAWQSRRLSERRRDRMPEAYAGTSAEVPPALTL